MQLQLLFALIFAEMATIVVFLFRTPLRRLVIIVLDRTKRGRGPIVAKTVAAILFAVMSTAVYNAAAVRRRCLLEGGELNPTDHILLARNLLEASLLGFSLFLALMIDRLHHYIRELRVRRKKMESLKKQTRVFQDIKPPASEEIMVLEQEVSNLQGRVKQLEAQIEDKTKEATGAEADAEALKMRSEEFLLEYGRLLEENQALRSQLQFLDHRQPV
ncbi:uncharacterized protein LOC127247857 [Andrographis paniculata]|uniref:uncharacterized protein LOC127247857 n=1 Tax=Andrographis paniculata TaxID=175694 RepID=UPI0021E7D00F|nr:uncharacterized protein LOC127247857 [Andrographis paniculata]